MDFWDYPSTWQVAGRPGGFRDFYSQLLALAHEMVACGRDEYRAEHNRFVNELDWYAAGTPYYKVHDDVLGLLCGVKLDVPCGYLRLPFASFAIRLPKTSSIRSILVGKGEPEPGDRRILLWIDQGETGRFGAGFELAARAIRRGKKGWTVGERSPTVALNSTGSGRPLAPPALSEWVRQTTVRPDLPTP